MSQFSTATPASAGDPRLFASSPTNFSPGDREVPSFGYPEAFHAHNHKTPERSNRQKKISTPATAPLTPAATPMSNGVVDDNSDNDDEILDHDIIRSNSSGSANGGVGRSVGKLNARHFKMFHANNEKKSLVNRTNNNGVIRQKSCNEQYLISGSPQETGTALKITDSGSSSSPIRRTPTANKRSSVVDFWSKKSTTASASNTHNNTGASCNTNLQAMATNDNLEGNSFQNIQDQIQKQHQPQQPPADHASTAFGTQSVASASTTLTSLANTSAKIPSSHINIITQAYGNSADIYVDVLQIPRDMTSDRDIRIAYFRRGRQVLAEKPDPASKTGGLAVGTHVSQLAKRRFQAVSMAYEILSNPAWKESYDKYGFFGHDASQEPPGTAAPPADDVSLADATRQHESRPAVNSADSPAAAIYNLRLAATSSPTDEPAEISLTTKHSESSSPIMVQPQQQRTSCHVTDHFPNKPGSPRKQQLAYRHQQPKNPNRLERHLEQQRKNITRHLQNENNPVTGGDNASYLSHSTAGTGTSSVLRKPGAFLEKRNKQKLNLRDNEYLPQPPASTNTVRWNEEVEELIFRQDPEEISFKTGNAPDGDLSYEQVQAQDPSASQERQPFSGYDSRGETKLVQNAQEGARNLLSSSANKLPNMKSHHGKKKVVLDTAELGSHLQKLDLVADSIAGIFDELEASFEGLGLGLSSSEKGNRQEASTKNTIPATQETQLPVDKRDVAPGKRVDVPMSPLTLNHSPASPISQAIDETSFHTPPASIGSNLTFLASDNNEQASILTPLTKEEEAAVEEQAMALLREVTAMDAALPADVVVKTKKNKHHQRQSQNVSDSHHEAISACASDGGAGTETATVATSVVSLLDAQQHTNAPLKPAATDGVKASRKRLKNIQRRRQQQQRMRDPAQQGTAYAMDDSLQANTLLEEDDPSSRLSVRDRADQLNSRLNAKKKKGATKGKSTEDLYFESLYNNFFALPKERLPNEMTVRTKPKSSGCSVSTLSHSVATEKESTSRLDFDLPWSIAAGAWPTLVEASEDDCASKDDINEKQRQEKHIKDVMARVDDMLLHHSRNSAMDTTFDSSLPDDFGMNTTYDSGTIVDTTFDSSAVDSGFTSAMDHRKGNAAINAIVGCQGTPAAFLNQVFDVPLEAPLEFLCGEVKDTSSSGLSTSGKAITRRGHTQRQSTHPKPELSPTDFARAAAGTPALGDAADTTVEESQSSDESATPLDPPTHDSRLYAVNRCDDSTLNTYNSSNDDEDESSCGSSISGARSLPIISVSPIPGQDVEVETELEMKSAFAAATLAASSEADTLSNSEETGEETNSCSVHSGIMESDTSDKDPGDSDKELRSTFEADEVEDDQGAGKAVDDKGDYEGEDDQAACEGEDTQTKAASKLDGADGKVLSTSTVSEGMSTGQSNDQGFADQAVNDSQSAQALIDRQIAETEADEAQSARRSFDVENASVSQIVDMYETRGRPRSRSRSRDAFEDETISLTSEIMAMLNEERENAVPDVLETEEAQTTIQSDSSYPNTDAVASSSIEVFTAPSSLSGKRIGIDSAITDEFGPSEAVAQNQSSGTSISSTVSKDTANPPSFFSNVLTYLNRVSEENPSLAGITKQLTYGLESCRASNEACMEAIVINDEDMTGMLEVLQTEISRPTTVFKTEQAE